MATASGSVREVAARMGRDPQRSIDRFFPPRQPAQAVVSSPAQQTSVLRFVLGGALFLAGFTAAIVGIVYLLGAEISRAGHSTDTTRKQIIIGNDVLAIPANAIRFRSQRRTGDSERVDMYFLWPEMAGYSERDAAAFNQTTVNPQLLFVTLEKRQMSQDMTGRIEPIYSKFMTGVSINAGHGLKRRALSAEGGFHQEDLWYEASSPWPFAARCNRPGESMAAPYCLRDIHVGRDLSVTYRFHLSLISDWMAIDAAIRAQIKDMIETRAE